MKDFFLYLRQWTFVPNFTSLVIMSILLPLCLTLGYWQLGRATEKKTWAKKISENHQRDINVDSLSKPLSYLYAHALEVQGILLNKHLVLDNQLYQGRIGYRIFTPFKIRGMDKYLLIDRGWLPVEKTRQILPKILEHSEQITLKGWIDKIPSPGLQLKKLFPESIGNAYRVQSFDFDLLQALFQETFYPIVLKLSSESPHVFQMIPFEIGLSPTRHLGYAWQWFTIALIITLYFGVFNFRRRAHQETL